VSASAIPDYPAEWRRALEMLAKSGDGCTTLVLFAQGFPSTVIARWVDCGLVTATTERVLANQRSVDVTRVRITDPGRLALAR